MSTFFNGERVLFIGIRVMKKFSYENIAISRHLSPQYFRYRSNIISPPVVVYGGKVIDTHIDCDSDEDFEFRNLGGCLFIIWRTLCSRIQICMVAKHSPDSTSSYEAKNRIWSVRHVYR